MKVSYNQKLCFLCYIIYLANHSMTQKQQGFDFQAFGKGSMPRFSCIPEVDQTEKGENQGKIPLKATAPAVKNRYSPVSRSIKKKAPAFQTSFESGFLDQHVRAFYLCSKNYIEASLRKKIQDELSFESPTVFGEEIEEDDYSSGINLKKNQFFSKKERAQFQKDLQTEDKLSDFLKELSEKLPTPIYREITFVAFIVWELYIKFRKPSPMEEELIEEAKKSAEFWSPHMFYSCGFEYVTLKKIKKQDIVNEEELLKNFKIFLQGFFGTVLLVLEGFFENPFSSPEKRQRPNDNLFDDPEEENQNNSNNQQPRKYRKTE